MESSQLGSELARYRAFVQAVESLKAAAATPLVLIVDDLQWADFATLEFLAFLMPRLASSQLLVLGAVRSEQLERDHARREALNRLSRLGAVTLAVPPLDGDEIRRLVSSIWPDASSVREREIERICSLAEGKPYFAEELVTSAAMAPQEPQPDLTPLSIRAGVLARFEQLDDAQRRILSYASVIGRSFDAALLAQVTAASNAAVAAVLTNACDVTTRARNTRKPRRLYVSARDHSRDPLSRTARTSNPNDSSRSRRAFGRVKRRRSARPRLSLERGRQSRARERGVRTRRRRCDGSQRSPRRPSRLSGRSRGDERRRCPIPAAVRQVSARALDQRRGRRGLRVRRARGKCVRNGRPATAGRLTRD